MAISLASLNRTTALKPPRTLIHGVHGVGKTTFAAAAPDPVFVLTEDGLGTLEVTVPSGTEATLELPDGTSEGLAPGDHARTWLA